MKVNISVYSLYDQHIRKNPNSHYFDRDTLRFFGESFSTMNVLKHTVEIKDISGEMHTCYVLSKLQRKHPMGARRTHDYFDINTFKHVVV